MYNYIKQLYLIMSTNNIDNKQLKLNLIARINKLSHYFSYTAEDLSKLLKIGKTRAINLVANKIDEFDISELQDYVNIINNLLS